MQVTLEKKKANFTVWIIVAVMIIAILTLIIFYAYQENPTERLPTDSKQENAKVIYYYEV